MNRFFLTGFCFASLIAVSNVSALGTTTIFTEDFNGSSANWANFNSSDPLTYFATGGPDGGSYASGPRTFNNLTPGNTTIMLRARHEDPWNSSNDGFKRDWLADGVGEVNLFVRHDYTLELLTYIMRVATEDNQHGRVYQAIGSAIPGGQWTPITFDVSADSAGLLSDEGNTYASVFSQIGYVTIGVFVPSGLPTNPNGSINSATVFNFDVDKVGIATPEPVSAVLGLVGLLGSGLTIRRRTRKSGKMAKESTR